MASNWSCIPGGFAYLIGGLPAMDAVSVCVLDRGRARLERQP
jgi:hypothetical protein